MDEWLQELQETLNTAARDSSQWWAEFSKEADQVVDEWVDASIEAVQDVEAALAPGLNRLTEQIDQAVDAGILFFDQQVSPWIEETTAPITNTVNPWLQNHPACIGCQHYHGTAYGDEMLVCGMHPYGPDDEACPDWEAVWPVDAER